MNENATPYTALARLNIVTDRPSGETTLFTLRGYASNQSAQLEVGMTDMDQPDFIKFGMGAEVFCGSSFSQEQVAEVAIGSIGTHTTTTAKLRVLAYQLATQLAEAMNYALRDCGLGIPEAAEYAVNIVAQVTDAAEVAL